MLYKRLTDFFDCMEIMEHIVDKNKKFLIDTFFPTMKDVISIRFNSEYAIVRCINQNTMTCEQYIGKTEFIAWYIDAYHKEC